MKSSICTKCNGHDHTPLHSQAKEASTPSPNTAPESTREYTQTSIKDTPTTVLLMTWQLKVMGPYGCVTKARALIDPGYHS